MNAFSNIAAALRKDESFAWEFFLWQARTLDTPWERLRACVGFRPRYTLTELLPEDRWAGAEDRALPSRVLLVKWQTKSKYRTNGDTWQHLAGSFKIGHEDVAGSPNLFAAYLRKIVRDDRERAIEWLRNGTLGVLTDGQEIKPASRHPGRGAGR